MTKDETENAEIERCHAFLNAHGEDLSRLIDEELEEGRHPKDFVVIGADLDDPDSKDAVRVLLEATGSDTAGISVLVSTVTTPKFIELFSEVMPDIVAQLGDCQETEIRTIIVCGSCAVIYFDETEEEVDPFTIN